VHLVSLPQRDMQLSCVLLLLLCIYVCALPAHLGCMWLPRQLSMPVHLSVQLLGQQQCCSSRQLVSM
jgi:hypothetical protein